MIDDIKMVYSYITLIIFFNVPGVGLLSISQFGWRRVLGASPLSILIEVFPYVSRVVGTCRMCLYKKHVTLGSSGS
jgi:hypothetical protein